MKLIMNNYDCDNNVDMYVHTFFFWVWYSFLLVNSLDHNSVLAQVFSDPFQVYPPKTFPGKKGEI